ncbi:MAG: sugar transferase [Elusimicrobia bacterium]|nr:sugar transferase [Elusimicrobiota bacterium]
MKKKLIFTSKFVFLVFDILALVFAYKIANILRHKTYIPEYYTELLILAIIFHVIFFYTAGFYRNLFIAPVYEFFRDIRTCGLSYVFLIATTFYWREYSISRLMLTYFFVFSVIFVFVERVLLRNLLDFVLRKFFKPDRVVIIGTGKILSPLRRRLKKKHQAALWLKKYPPREELKNILARRNFSEVLIAHFPIDHRKTVEIAELCEEMGISFRVVPDILELKLGDLVMDELLGIPVLRLKPTPLAGTHLFMKNVFDVFFSLFILGVLSPFLLIIAFIIKLDSPGPVLYIHKRRGKGGRDFKFYKFRTMFTGADKIFNDIREKHYQEKGALFKLKNDPRVTRVGKILRKFSIDEIPQFYNVLKGDMSVVGPRPQIIPEAEKYDSSARRRLRIKPGITGLWQVSGRSELPYSEMIRLDLFYVQNWSMEEDFMIILRTIPAIFRKKGAY